MKKLKLILLAMLTLSLNCIYAADDASIEPNPIAKEDFSSGCGCSMATKEVAFFAKGEKYQEFLGLVDSAERAYDPAVNFCNLNREVELLNSLYDYKKRCEVEINNFDLKKSELNQEDIKKIDQEYLALTKEVIRRLEDHLFKVHGWKPVRHFSSIAKPIVYGAGLTLGAILVAKILDYSGALPKGKFNQTAITCGAAGFFFTLVWILYNYKDVIYLQDKKNL